MIICEGSDKKVLQAKLNELNQMTRYDSIIKPNQRVTVSASATGSGLQNWKIETDAAGYSPAPPKNGRKFNDFFKAIDSMDLLSDVDTYDVYVLGHYYTEPAVTYDGKYVSKWFMVNPYMPYEIEPSGKHPDTETILVRYKTLKLTEAEYKAMMETKLAIMADDTIYPFTKESLLSAGRILDARTAFKDYNEHILGSVLLLAEAVAARETLKTLSRQVSGRVRPILSLTGERFIEYPQNEFFRDIFDELADYGIYRIRKWSVWSDHTEMDVILGDTPDYQYGVVITGSDNMGIPMSLTAYARYETPEGPVSVHLLTNTMRHNRPAIKDKVKPLFNRVDETFEKLQADTRALKNINVFYSDGLVKDIKKSLQKKRCRKIVFPPARLYNGQELFLTLIGNFEKVHPDNKEMKEAYATLMGTLINNKAEEEQEACGGI